MGLLFWRKRSQHRIDHVVVPESAIAEGHYRLDPTIHVQMFVKHALTSAMYARDELPHEALLGAHVGDYFGEVNNGGHAQFVGNTGWDEDVRADVREGLAVLGQHEAARIFADLEAFAIAEPKRFARHGGVYCPTPDIDPYFNELDDRYYGPIAEALEAANDAWIKTWPFLRTITEAEYRQNPSWKVPDHPLREARWKAYRRRFVLPDSFWKHAEYVMRKPPKS